MTSAELEKQRVEFWATYGSGAYGGSSGVRRVGRGRVLAR